MEQFWLTALTNYVLKLLIAVGLTPFIYFSHSVVKKYLGKEFAHIQEEKVSKESLNEKV